MYVCSCNLLKSSSKTLNATAICCHSALFSPCTHAHVINNVLGKLFSLPKGLFIALFCSDEYANIHMTHTHTQTHTHTHRAPDQGVIHSLILQRRVRQRVNNLLGKLFLTVPWIKGLFIVLFCSDEYVPANVDSGYLHMTSYNRCMKDGNLSALSEKKNGQKKKELA